MPATFTYPSADGTPVTAYRWDPAARPRAIVQLTHGMGEHAFATGDEDGVGHSFST